jgi:hypothetical protein
LNIATKRVVLSRNVRWLDQNYTNYKKSQGLWDPSEEDDPDDVSNEEYGNDDDMAVPEQRDEATTNNNNHDNTPSWAAVTGRRVTRSATKSGAANLNSLGRPLRPNAKMIRQLAA